MEMMFDDTEMVTRDPEDVYAYTSTVREEYGLTDKMIAELGPPDKRAANPHHAGGPPARLYLRTRVEAWVAQNSERVEKARENRAKRRAAGVLRD
jgi:hypothetical protein